MKKIVALLGTGLLLAACDVTYPVTVVGGDGMTLRGFASNTFLQGGSFQATNGRVTCGGTYTQHGDIRTVGFPVTCSNGLQGIGTASFESPTRGSGLVTMEDGSSWQFIFGQAARRI